MENEIEDLEKGDKILFNDRKKPLEVVEKIEKKEAKVEGPGGATYILYKDGKTDLFASEGNRKYSSYLEDLRKIGQWNTHGREEWVHSKTGAKIIIEDNNGLWQVTTEGFSPSMESPLYGFTTEQVAVEHVQKIIEKHPEGKTHEKI